MNDVQRLAYLRAMGIESYVSRRDLPGALPSRRLRLVRAESRPLSAPLPPGSSSRLAPDQASPADAVNRAADTAALDSLRAGIPASPPSRPESIATPAAAVGLQ